MPTNMPNSLINFGDLSKPADTLIKKISNAVGVLFEPRQIKRVSKAKAEAAKTAARSEIEITDLHRRAARRWIEEEAQQQKNMEDVTAKAVPQLNENANPDSMENDWIVNFFDKSRIVSDGEMQELWSRVLAGEANAPGSYSKRTVNFLSALDKAEADLFTELGGFVWMIERQPVPLVFAAEAKIYNNHMINFTSLNHLDSIGLIQFGQMMGLSMRIPKRSSVAYYYGRPFALDLPRDTDNQLDIGTVTLTRTGRELLPLCSSKPVEGFLEYVKDHWKEYWPKEKTEGA